MPTQSLLWTVLPDGVPSDAKGAGTVRLSLLCSPRLDAATPAPPPGAPAGTLALFDDLLDWPARLTRALASGTVRLGVAEAMNGDAPVSPRWVTLDATHVDATLGAPQSAVWTALFPPTTRVRPRVAPDRTKNAVLSYDAVAVHELLRELYGRVGAMGGDDLPTLGSLRTDQTLREVRDAVAETDGRSVNPKTGRRDVGALFRAADDGSLTKGRAKLTPVLAPFQLFHTPAAPTTEGNYDGTDLPADDPRRGARWTEFKSTTLPTAAQLVDALDFHVIVAAVAQYPALARRLGLVLDLRVPRALLTPRSEAPLWLWASVDLGADAGALRRRSAAPYTVALLTAGDFRARGRAIGPDAPELRVERGRLAMGDGRTAVLQADVDGGGLKLLNLARTLTHVGDGAALLDPVTKHARREGLPALRTAGLMLVHRRRGAQLDVVFDRNAARETAIGAALAVPPARPTLPAPVALHAEDLVRGWRVDAWDATTKVWRSLCWRAATYTVGTGGAAVVVQAVEEGTVRLAMTTPTLPPLGPAGPTFASVHEAMLSWSGWSLAVRPPGRTVATDDRSIDGAPPVASGDAEVPDGVPLRVAFAPLQPATAPPARLLPRLRYGRAYAFRLRAVDLAGNAMPPRETDYPGDDPAARATPFLRHEPIQPPALALRRIGDESVDVPREGESMARLAIRTFRAGPDVQANATAPSAEVARRVAVPPRVPMREAELHGALDAAVGRDAAAVAAWWTTVTTRDRDLTPLDPEARRPDTSAARAAADKDALRAMTIPGPLDQATTPPDPDAWPVHRVGDPLPYLPDPLCRTIAARLIGHPGIARHAVIPIPLYVADDGVTPTRWPDARPFTIEVYEPAGAIPAPATWWVPDGRVLRIPLPKGVRATLRLSAMTEPATRELLGVWRWIRDPLPPAERAARELLAQDGKLWALTPWRSVELVHATQLPMLVPAFESFDVTRALGDTFVRASAVAACSVATTDRLELVARWNEPRRGTAPALGATAGTPPVADVGVDGDAAPALNAGRNAACTARAFALKVTDETTYVAPSPGPDKPDLAVVGPDRVQFGARSGELARRLSERVHDFGDTRYRRVEYRLDATTRFREFMPAALQTETIRMTTRLSDAQLAVRSAWRRTWAPNAAPPPAPSVLYVVPTFAWTRETHATGTRRSERRGGGLRIYLDGPWHESGYGEMLAVTLPPAADPSVDPNVGYYKQAVTQWGNDPLWATPPVPGTAPTAGAFPLRRTAPDLTGAWLPAFAPAEERDQPTTAELPGAFRTTGLGHPALPPDAPTGHVDVAPHDVRWDAERQLWYCDVEVRPGTTYAPFVRLALARYQPVSVVGAHLSTIVLADFMTLAPDRWVTVTAGATPNARQVRVFGHAPSATASGRELSMANVAPGNVVEAWLERLDPSLGTDFGWRRVEGGATPVVSATQARGPVGPDLPPGFGTAIPAPELWAGTVTIPRAPVGARFRLVVTESEEYLVGGAEPYEGLASQKARRVVFAEHVELAI